jgi:hypothetical protein
LLFSRFYKTLFFILGLFSIISCVSNKPYYARTELNWQQNKPDSSVKPLYSVFLIGDAGEPNIGQSKPLQQFLYNELKKSDTNAAILFLGDNIYPYGLPEEGNIWRKSAEKAVQNQFDIVKDFKGKVIFLPGNHDWNKSKKGGVHQLRREEEYIEKQSGGKYLFIPDSACPGPLVLKLQEKITLIALDTEWWLHRHEKPYGESSPCSSKTKEELTQNLKSVLEAHKNENVIVAAHHPLFSDGAHGGYFPAKSHLFPLIGLKKNLYIPFPVIGSLYPLYRKFVGSVQDIPHPRYREMKTAYLSAFSTYPNLVYASGHDHNLQYFENQNRHYIISGSGSKTEYLRSGGHAKFSHLANGFSRIDYYSNGEVWLGFWAILVDIAKKDPQEVKLVYRKKLK